MKTLSANPELLCLHLELPTEIAARLAPGEMGVKARHLVERELQKWFFNINEAGAFVRDGKGGLDHAAIFILTDDVRWALCWLETVVMFFPAGYLPGDPPRKKLDLRAHAAIGIWDKEDNIWRTYHPQTTRPFWTFLEAPEKIAALLQEGRAQT